MASSNFHPPKTFPDVQGGDPDSDVNMADPIPATSTPMSPNNVSTQVTNDNRPLSSTSPPHADGNPTRSSKETHRAENVLKSKQNAVRSVDLVASIPGCYRVLDLINEQGSGGLVDKIIIEQESLGRLVNALRRDAFFSITKVDFAALDEVNIKAIGIYGSKPAIVDFLLKKNLLRTEVAACMLEVGTFSADTERPLLRSGIYILVNENEDTLYVIYWPEDSTWDDGAASSVRKNRITFMRYLTKITDQVVCLLSNEHVNAIVWRDELDTGDEEMDDDEGDRLFAFEVSKTNEQEEGAAARDGFTLHSSLIAFGAAHRDIEANADLVRPRLATGETAQGIVTATYLPAQEKKDTTCRSYNTFTLKSLLQQESIRLGDALSSEALDILLSVGLKHGAIDAVACYKQDVEGVKTSATITHKRNLDDMLKRIDNESAILLQGIEEYLMHEVVLRFPLVATDSLDPVKVPLPPDDESHALTAGSSPDEALEYINILTAMYPDIQSLLQEGRDASKLHEVSSPKYKTRKERILASAHLLSESADMSEEQRMDMVMTIMEKGPGKQSSSGGGFVRFVFALIGPGSTSSPSSSKSNEVPREVLMVKDPEFLSRLSYYAGAWPPLVEHTQKLVKIVQQHFRENVKKEAKAVRGKIQSLQRRQCKEQIERQIEFDRAKRLGELRINLLKALQSCMTSPSTARKIFTITHLEVERSPWGTHYYTPPPNYKVTILEETYSDPMVCYTLYPLDLTQQDRHCMQEDASYVPTPLIRPNSSSKFTLPADIIVLRLHLLPGGRCLLITRDRRGDGRVYVSPVTHLQDAVARGRVMKDLKRDKIGENILLSYDENKRILAVCSTFGRESRLELHTFAFDETYTSLQGMGSAVKLNSWYDSSVSIRHMEFVSGSEEILLVDDFARARLFSLVAQQFRPATLQLSSLPSAVFATPDGSCFLAMESPDASGAVTLRAYHWSSFGSSEGINVDVPGSILHLKDQVITSIMSRNNVYLLALDPDEQALRSTAFNISRKVTEFTFKEKGGSAFGRGRDQSTLHNCLIDCHEDVWTRFPVVPAVGRKTIISSSLRRPRSLTFVSNSAHTSFPSHFNALIDNFERTTRKPVGDELSSILVLSIDHDNFADEYPFTPSTFRAGEWLVELLCLIPIHIAVTRDNRFVPLKDGVWSAELERSLLGADVAKIVNSISFGWYESLFLSYMAQKPVKVVSSMGEQSVGKSFALNHLVDTSFAGSAMRTTEGVWMSVTPTEEALIVALDFEGVHSIERSAQEDTLLVLFNTAISNLVLFRNNYALSRDITGLFQSFQSSASVLDPAANPMLFQSTLMIIIKDVVESDKNEIKKEFHLKFQQIVQAEQGMNFITRLHRNRLDIVPWPVIESKQFYLLFKAVKRRLDQQAITHSSGAVFLQTMKTLMAKLKANDWGSMSQNLATHRAQLLMTLLPNALVFGAMEVDPDFEPLKDFDKAMVIDMPDTQSRFHIGDAGPEGQPSSRKDALHGLCVSWSSYMDRFAIPASEWMEQLQDFLNNAVDIRTQHVRAWLTANTASFPANHADMQALHRMFDGLAIDLKASVQLCSVHCESCNLNCTLERRHDGTHDCQTDHHCPQYCQYNEGADHDETKPCGLLAGHPGWHLCDVTAHLCGHSCKLSGKKGCQEACIKTVDHEDGEHMCAAKIHECGLLCSLSGVRLYDGQIFSCGQSCSIASDISHKEHRCDNRQCPIGCQLCKRLCSERDHLHGMDPHAIHLCGQEHACAASCSAKGICQIETAPQSIEATFTGRHESFQYTKYSQVSKRLPCVVMIPAGQVGHLGQHTHDQSAKCFHHCENRCPDCGYFCTLPLDHTQQEHETSHGSMSKTKWAVHGPDGTVLEVNGRKFGSNDDGAPMLCSMYCQSMGRHAHIDWCRSDDPGTCGGAEHEHISAPMRPYPGKAKDWITHGLYWKRSGFKDPYSQEDQTNFAKCDRMCGGPEHNATAQAAAQPSYCTLPMLHPRQTLDQGPPGGLGYISNDGHAFMCRNPAVLRQAFHVIFVIDRSGSMGSSDRTPLDNTPTTQLIRRTHNDRLGAVCSSLQGFWEARHHAVAAAGGNAGAGRRDAYTVILFNQAASTIINHDFQSPPQALLSSVLRYHASGGTNFTDAIRTAQASVENHWSNERTPVVIFLSDGECTVADETLQDLCRRSIALGKPLSFHAVAFGPSTGSLRRMAQIARDVESRAPPDPLNPHAGVPSSYTEALDTVRLAETFLGIADSLAKPRGALFRG